MVLNGLVKMATELDKNRKSRGVLRASFTRVLNELDSFLETDSPSSEQVAALFEMAEQKFEVIKCINSKIYEALLKTADEDELLKEVEATDVYT